MGINDEYSRDAYDYEIAYDSDASDEFDNELDPEDWQAMYSDELLNAWMKIRCIFEENYIKSRAGYADFIDLVMNPSDWHSPHAPCLIHRTMWINIKDMPIICDRIQAENFYAWSENFIDHL